MGDEKIDPILSAPGEGESVPNPVGGFIEFKARAEQTAGALTAFESAPAPSEGPPLHVHPDEDEVIHFAAGRFRLKTEDVVRPAPEGSFAYIPKGMPHTWQNVGDAPGRILVLFLPAAAGMEQFFERYADQVAGEGAAAAFGALADVGGMQVVGPPLSQSDPP
jgi:quercetin dioxygenase-like cupin family protein